MFIFSPDPTKLINYDSSVIIYPSQISIERGENTSLFFKYVDSGGIGVDLSEYDASLVIKRYPTSEKILFFMNQDTVLYGTTSEDFLYSPTADTIGVGGSIVNQDDEENSMTGGIVFPIYGGDTVGIPKGNHYYEVSIRSNQERKMLFEGRIYVDDPKGATVPQEIPQKNIEIVRGEDRKFFFRKVDNYGNGIDLTGTSAIFTVRRYPSADNPLLYASKDQIYTENASVEPTETDNFILTQDENENELLGGVVSNYTIVNQDENGNELLGGVVCSIPNPISISISPGRYFYRIDLIGSNQFTNPIYEGRIDFIQGFVNLSLGLPERLTDDADFSPTIPISIPDNVIVNPVSLRKETEPNTILNNYVPFDSENDQSGVVLIVGDETDQNITEPVILNADPGTTQYEWKRNNTVVSTSESYTLSLGDKDSIITVKVTASNANPSSDSKTTFIVLGNPTQDSGWTDLSQFIDDDSRIVYVSSTVGSNETASAIYGGRGYYLPTDPEIGEDPTNPTGEVVAYLDYNVARSMMRNDSADWILFKRGDTISVSDPALVNEAITMPRGKSAEKRSVLSSYGNILLPRPILLCGRLIESGANAGQSKRAFFFVRQGKTVVSSVEPRWIDTETSSGPGLMNIRSTDTNGTDVLLEDILFKGSVGANYGKRITLKRCIIADAFNAGQGHVQGYFGGTSELLIEECVFDRNGFKEDPNNPSTWTRSVVANNMAVGTGVQPKRDFFCRNLYLSGTPEIPPTLRGNIFSRDPGGSSVQMRNGGISERNAFLWNEQALLTSHPQRYFYYPQGERPNWIGFNATEKKYRYNTITQEFDPNGDILRVPTPGIDFPFPENTIPQIVSAVVDKNLVLHDDHMLPPGGWGIALQTGAMEYLEVNDNVICHFHRGTNGSVSGFSVSGIGENNSDYLPTPVSRLNYGIFTNNAILRNQGSNSTAGGVLTLSSIVDFCEVNNNAIAGTLFCNKLVNNRLNPVTNASSSVNNNLYYNNISNSFEYRDLNGTVKKSSFENYQLDTGFELQSTFYSNFEEFKQNTGWIEPERDLISYMEFIDPTYQVNEDVTVDDGVPEENRRPNAPKVWEVLIDPSYGGHSSHWFGDNIGGNIANAKLIARRYHAFITFIERAKANRKGNWDIRYTADALNDYIREGFGKSSLFTTPYDPTSIKIPYTAEMPSFV